MSSLVKIAFVEAGSCTHSERSTMQGGRFGAVRFPSSVAVIEHPRFGVTLFDTGYSQWFFEATKRYPARLYAKMTPVALSGDETAVARLRACGIQPSDVQRIVLSHFHADHIAGARDFPEAKFVFAAEAYASVARRAPGFGQLLAGFLPELLPDDFTSRAEALTPPSFRATIDGMGAFGCGHDLFGDGSLFVIELPGHAAGHVGLLAQTSDGPLFLVGDACWSSRAYRENRMPSALVWKLLQNGDREAYAATLASLHDLSRARPDLRIVPCHCGDALAALPRLEPPLRDASPEHSEASAKADSPAE